MFFLEYIGYLKKERYANNFPNWLILLQYLVLFPTWPMWWLQLLIFCIKLLLIKLWKNEYNARKWLKCLELDSQIIWTLTEFYSKPLNLFLTQRLTSRRILNFLPGIPGKSWTSCQEFLENLGVPARNSWKILDFLVGSKFNIWRYQIRKTHV